MNPDTPLVLASASPRRRELLALIGIPYGVRPLEVEECMEAEGDAVVVALRMARMKAEAMRLTLLEPPILAADTVVANGRCLLGKPRDADEAREMLRALRGGTHRVVTAVALMPRGGRGTLTRNPVTYVTMRAYDDEEIEASVARGDPFDKAGGYAIQDEILRPVESYEGCYCNVVGLPLWSVIEMLRKLGNSVTVDAEDLLPQCATCSLAPRSSVLT